MLPIALTLKPGVDTQRTPLQVGQGLTSSNLIRHRNGLIQKLAGCTRLSNTTFVGQARALLPWQDLIGNTYLAIGTNGVLQLYSGGQITTISPIAHTSNLTSPFSTTAGSSVVTIADGGFGPSLDSYIYIQNLTYVGGLLLQGLYQVASTGAGSYTINAGSPATSTSSSSAVLHFSTTSGSSTVKITLGTYTFLNGQTVTVGVSTAVGGLTFLGNYAVAVSGGNFDIVGGGNATSTTSGSENGGQTQINYLLALPDESLPVGSYGFGPYGFGPYGYGQQASGQINLVEWSLDKWGQNLVACYKGSTVYQWVPPVAIGNVAEAVSGAPSAANGLFVAAPQQQTFAWGIFSGTLAAQDPLLMGWCDVANLNQWAASATNQAGTFRLSSGSLIVSGTWFGLIGLVWTDIDVWSISYIGFPLVYSFNKLAQNCGLISRRAFATLGTLCIWMSQQDFFVYQGGAVAPIPCTVRDFVFSTLDTNYAEAIHADSNTYGDEVTFWFPQIGSNGVCTGAVKININDRLWDITSSGLSVAAWCDQSPLGPPIGAFYSGLLEQFETSIDFDGQPLDSFIVSGFFQIAEGEEFVYVDRIYPDFNITAGGSINLTIYFADDMASAANPALVRTYGPYTITSTTPYVIVRGRGRVAQIRLDCIQSGTFWRYGSPLAQISIDGRR